MSTIIHIRKTRIDTPRIFVFSRSSISHGIWFILIVNTTNFRNQQGGMIGEIEITTILDIFLQGLHIIIIIDCRRLYIFYNISQTVNRNPQHLDISGTQFVDVFWCKHHLFHPMTWVVFIIKPVISGLFVIVQACSFLNKDSHLCLGFWQLTTANKQRNQQE